MEAIILAGGLGTRLRSVINEVPKPMAPVANRPFLDYIFYYLKNEGVKKVILAVGYKWEMIRDRYEDKANTFGLEIEYSVETEPLGTGGAIFKAAEKATDNGFFIINGDTSFEIKLAELKNFALEKNAGIALALKEINGANRYGSVKCTDQGQVLSFIEKSDTHQDSSLINGGVYFIQKKLIDQFTLPLKFSFETDFMQSKLSEINAYAKKFNAAFIDIGIPEDYYKAQELFKNAIA